MNHRPSRQQGMTLISFLILFAMVGFFILLGLKLSPIYLEHYKITTTLNNLKNEPEIGEKSAKEIAYILQKRWDVNGIDRINTRDSLTAEMDDGDMVIQVEYEVAEPIIGNVSALVKFKDSIKIGR